MAEGGGGRQLSGAGDKEGRAAGSRGCDRDRAIAQPCSMGPDVPNLIHKETRMVRDITDGRAERSFPLQHRAGPVGFAPGSTYSSNSFWNCF